MLVPYMAACGNLENKITTPTNPNYNDKVGPE
jgi:hypothetical protein